MNCLKSIRREDSSRNLIGVVVGYFNEDGSVAFSLYAHLITLEKLR